MVFPRQKLAIQVRGCFWHQHEACGGARIPGSNLDYWKAKLERNVLRDAAKDAELRGLGWRILFIWKCEAATADGLTATVGRVRQELHPGP
ncbi:hypothetical protein [Methylobacterium gnaphalii]|uniref:Very short patch repair endonuclease n=1 Tax=Methylobacterium gnaphalii TaxID=1010610 RepID=A0A512JJQ8_9HYPH|nr:hypothetical protein MGN01_20410 [Methylobacterium gnaphalii]GJD70241.1 Very short patch repair protein [Methylobacterium gnaphalii]GLS48713.1 hypothetical protein GCM10007885_15570 [Methylobacterium gnaphalii]